MYPSESIGESVNTQASEIHSYRIHQNWRAERAIILHASQQSLVHSSFEDESLRLHFHCSLGNYKDAGFCSYARSSDLLELRDLGNQGIHAFPSKSST